MKCKLEFEALGHRLPPDGLREQSAPAAAATLPRELALYAERDAIIAILRAVEREILDAHSDTASRVLYGLQRLLDAVEADIAAAEAALRRALGEAA